MNIYRRCINCGTKNVLRLTGEALNPGTCMFYTCGKCGERGVAITPGDSGRDEVINAYDGVFDKLDEILSRQ